MCWISSEICITHHMVGFCDSLMSFSNERFGDWFTRCIIVVLFGIASKRDAYRPETIRCRRVTRVKTNERGNTSVAPNEWHDKTASVGGDVDNVDLNDDDDNSTIKWRTKRGNVYEEMPWRARDVNGRRTHGVWAYRSTTTIVVSLLLHAPARARALARFLISRRGAIKTSRVWWPGPGALRRQRFQCYLRTDWWWHAGRSSTCCRPRTEQRETDRDETSCVRHFVFLSDSRVARSFSPFPIVRVARSTRRTNALLFIIMLDFGPCDPSDRRRRRRRRRRCPPS